MYFDPCNLLSCMCVCVLISYCNDNSRLLWFISCQKNQDMYKCTLTLESRLVEWGALNILWGIWCWPAPSQNCVPRILTRWYRRGLWSNHRVKQQCRHFFFCSQYQEPKPEKLLEQYKILQWLPSPDFSIVNVLALWWLSLSLTLYS